jgi:hypothetical protein
MKHCGPFMMDEASLSRAYQHVVDKKSPSWGIVTAHRSVYSKKENEARNKQLEKDLRGMGYGFFKMEGHWQECQDSNIDYKDCPKDQLKDATETSLFVPGIKEHEISNLCKKYDQDSVIYGDTKKDHTKLIFRNGAEDDIGKFHPNKIAQAYSKFKGGSTFSFIKPDKKDEPKKDIFGKELDTKPDINKLKSMLPKDVLNKTVKNPKTGNTIKVKSALSYDKKSPVFQAAKQLITKK